MKWTTKTSTIYPFKGQLPYRIFLALIFCFYFSAARAQSSIAYLRATTAAVSKPITSTHSDHHIPFELVRGMIVMQASVDQQPGHFILDTGAPLMIINDQPKVPSRLAASFKQELEVGETVIEDFDWAGAEEKRLDALVLDISHLEQAFQRPLKGMIGFNALKDYELFFDYQNRFVLRYNARRNVLHANARPLYSIPFQKMDHLPVISITIGKKKFRFGLDTGACTNLIDSAALEALDAEWITRLPDEEVQGLDQRINRVKAVQFKAIEARGLVMEDMKFLATDLPQLQTEDGVRLDGLLGYDFLSKMKFSINYPKRRIYVWEE